MPLKVNELYETSFMVSSASSTNSIAKRSSIKHNTLTGSNINSSVVNKTSKARSNAGDSTYSHLSAIDETIGPDPSYSTLKRENEDKRAAVNNEKQGILVPAYEIVDDDDFVAGSYSTLGPRAAAAIEADAFNGSSEPASTTYSTLNRSVNDDSLLQLAGGNYTNGVLTNPSSATMSLHDGSSGAYNTLSNDREGNTASTLYSTLDRSTSPPDAGLYSVMQSLSPAPNPVSSQYDHIDIGGSSILHDSSALPAEPELVNDNSHTSTSLPTNASVLMQSYEQTALMRSYEQTVLRGFEFAPDEDL